MAIAPITTWLRSADKNYQLGVAIYEQYGTRSLLKTLFRCGASDYTHNRLIEALEELNEQSQDDRPAGEIIKPLPSECFIPILEAIPVAGLRHGLSDPEWEKAPDKIKDLIVANSRMRSRADMLFVQARSASTAAERLAMALTILADRSQINQNWTVVKEFYKTGVLQAQIEQEQEKKIPELSVQELIISAGNLATYISKDRKKLQALQGGTAKFDKTAKRLQENEVRHKLIKERLANA